MMAGIFVNTMYLKLLFTIFILVACSPAFLSSKINYCFPFMFIFKENKKVFRQEYLSFF